MSEKKISDADLIRLLEDEKKTIEGIAREYKMNARSLHKRRRLLEVKIQKPLGNIHKNSISISKLPGWINLNIRNGTIFIGSDFHIWPGPKSTAVRAFIKLIKKFKPRAVIANGDVMDFNRISRYPPIGWTSVPTIREEMEAAETVMDEIARAAGHARKIWTLGNHDARFETRLATYAPEYAAVRGTSLKDHFPLWEPCWAIDINGNIVVKHRFKGGIHATHNNSLWSGRTTITGHQHSQQVRPFTDYNGTRYGVDCGCMADISSRAFLDYTEANPLNWRAGFIILTICNGFLLTPEMVSVVDESTVQFRGELISV